jgi:pimeloyl-ACP methyl ester carboxylesterase
VPFAEVTDYRVCYEEQGSGDAVLLVAGITADHAAWELQTDALRQRYRVVAFDNPGVGRTEGPPGPYSTELFADVATGLLDGLGIDRAHVVGASMGGTIAQQISLRRPELVRSLSLHCTWSRPDAWITTLFRSWEESARGLDRLEAARGRWLYVFTPGYLDREGVLDDLEREEREAPFPQTVDGFCDQAAACLAHDAYERLAEIAAPTLVTVGDSDFLTPAYLSRAIAERIPGARLHVWEGMGHAPFYEIPERFNELQLAFLAESEEAEA